MSAYVYVDGFNLYYGALKNTPYKWIDLERLVVNVLKNVHVSKIYYCTAPVAARQDDPDQPNRQQIFFRALRTNPKIEIVEGRFTQHVKTMPICNANRQLTGDNARVLKTEEKGSDVNLASLLVLHAATNAFEKAIVVSNDSDLVMPIKIAREELGKTVGILVPHKQPSLHLKAIGTFVRPIRPGALQVSQLPEQLSDANGSFQKPETWKA